MKKKWLIVLIIVVIALPIIWWYMQSSLSSGIYLEDYKGLVVAKIKEDDRLIEFQLPLQWIKAHPLEKLPLLEDIVLLDRGGEAIASIEGEYRLQVDYSENKWNKRNIRGQIQLYLNGNMLVKEGSTVTTPISNTLKESYMPESLNLVHRNKEIQFPMANTYKVLPLVTDNLNPVGGWSMRGFIPLFDSDPTVKGYMFHLKGSRGTVLEEILFWLPEITDEYMNNQILFSYDGSLGQYSNMEGEFSGEPLDLPLEMSSNNIYIYFPITEDIEKVVGRSIMHIMPYFRLLEKGKHHYFIGGAGGSGPLNWNMKREEYVISPN